MARAHFGLPVTTLHDLAEVDGEGDYVSIGDADIKYMLAGGNPSIGSMPFHRSPRPK